MLSGNWMPGAHSSALAPYWKKVNDEDLHFFYNYWIEENTRKRMDFPTEPLLINKSFWRVLKVCDNFTCVLPKEPLIPFFANMRLVCKEWRDNIPYVQAAQYLLKNVLINRIDAERRFGLTQHRMKSIVHQHHPKYVPVDELVNIFYENRGAKLYHSIENKREKKRKLDAIYEQKIQRLEERSKRIDQIFTEEGMPLQGDHRKIVTSDVFDSDEILTRVLRRVRFELYVATFHSKDIKRLVKEFKAQCKAQNEWAFGALDAAKMKLAQELVGIDFTLPYSQIILSSAHLQRVL